jgi:succinate dehydrogenase / fumarate reductase iron-sulfur subunit
MTPKTALLHPHKAPKEVTQAFDRIEGRDQRVELNLYVSGYEDEDPSDSHTETAQTPGTGAESGSEEL